MAIFLRVGAWYRATNKELYPDIDMTDIIADPNAEYPIIDVVGLPIQTGHAGEFLSTDGLSASWEAVSGGGGITNITYANLVTAINGSTLSAGKTYKITDRGDRGLFFTAISTNQLAKDGTRLMLCPATYAVEIDGSGNDWIGVWNITKSVAAGQLAIWGGLVFENLTGNIGTATTDILLDVVNWVVIPKASFSNDEYVEIVFGCNYDVTNDWIERQWDGKGNLFGIDYLAESTIFNAGFNYCDVSDWNFETSAFLFIRNRAMGGYNNSTNGHIMRNICEDVIAKNSNQSNIADNWTGGGILNNSHTGSVLDNFIDSDIDGNSNGGDISYNRCTTIAGNSNSGHIRQNNIPLEIEDNSNAGNISQNRNNGSIVGIGAANANIINNTNNGNIETTTTGDISDPIVDK